MKRLRVLICDDEPLALDRLGDLLGRCDGVELVSSALDGDELLQQAVRQPADVIFLDVEMPGIDGFDVVDALAKSAWADMPPLIIFVTAHPETAATAFDSGALDFISKPVRLSRLERALERARHACEQREAGRRLRDLSEQLDALKRLREPEDQQGQHIWLERRTETVRVDVDALDWIEAEGEYVRYHAQGQSYLQRGPLTEVAARLAPHGFVRVHRSAVVNPASLVSAEKTRWGGLILHLRSGDRLRVGKSFRRAARSLIA